MAYEQLLQQGRIKPYRARPEEIRRLLRVAARDLVTAERTLATDHDWAQVFGDERLTAALLDRLTHRAHILEFAGESFQFRQRMQREPRKKKE